MFSVTVVLFSAMGPSLHLNKTSQFRD
jgi:hypothetical protein